MRRTFSNSDLIFSSDGSTTTVWTLAEDELFDLDEAEQRAVADVPGVDLVDLPLAHENDLEKLLVYSWSASSVTKSVRV